jgi:transposase
MALRDLEKRRAYQREYQRSHPRDRVDIVRLLTHQDRKLLAEALQEICPEGLTDDCPARRARHRTAV